MQLRFSYITDHSSANTTKQCLKIFVTVELCKTSISDVTFTTFYVTFTSQTKCCCCGGREGKIWCRATITNKQFCLQAIVSKPLRDNAYVTVVWNCVLATKSTFLVFTNIKSYPDLQDQPILCLKMYLSSAISFHHVGAEFGDAITRGWTTFFYLLQWCSLSVIP